MLNSKRGNGASALWALLLTVLVALPLQVGAQQSQAGKNKGKRPPLRVRVVTDSRVGINVVTSQDPSAAAPSAGAIPTHPNVQIVMEEGVSAGPTEPEVENWLVDGPVAPESWLEPSAGISPAASPTAGATANTPSVGRDTAPAETGSTQLVGVQHYMESTRADERRGGDPSARNSVPHSLRPTASPGASAPPTTEGTYLLGPGDGIEVYVWRNPDLSLSVPVRPDGMISLPLAGELLASGKTVAQLGEEITVVLGEFIQQPTVTVTVTAVRSFVVYVTGQVAGSGPLTLDRPVNVVQAIAMAGGVLEFANRNGVVVIRTVGGRPVRIPYRYGDALKGKGEIAELILQSGDVVYVP